MKIENLISLVEEISLELARIRDTIEPEEYESWFQDNLEQAHDLLSEVKDLIGLIKTISTTEVLLKKDLLLMQQG